MAVFYTRNSCFIIFATVGYKKGKPQIRAYVNHLHIPQPTYFRPNRLRNKQKDLLFQYSIPLYTYF